MSKSHRSAGKKAVGTRLQLGARDAALLWALASDPSGSSDERITLLLSPEAQPVAVALRAGGPRTRTEAGRRAQAILDSVEENRAARRRRLASGIQGTTQPSS